MFDRITDFIRKAVNRLLNRTTVAQKLNVDIAVSDTMTGAIDLWAKMYADEPPYKSASVQTMNLPAGIAGEHARLVTMEMKSSLSGSPRADFLNVHYQQFLQSIRPYCEYACAKGGAVFKPYVNGGAIHVDVVQADCFFPTAFDGKGKITAAIFAEQKTIGRKYYTRLEYHNRENTGYIITNTAYVSDSSSDIGRQTTLDAIPEWTDIEPEVRIANIDRPLFAYFKMPFANTSDPFSPLGVSVFSLAVNLIEEADKQYSRLLWEMEGSELAVHADISAFNEKGTLPTGKKRLYRKIDVGNDKLLDIFSPEIRDVSLINGLNEILRKIEFMCGLAYGTLSDVRTVDKTATEIKYSKQRSYSTVVDIQSALKNALEQLVYSMDVLATLYKLAPGGKYALACEFDDSIVTDMDIEFARRLQMVSAGMYSDAEFRSWYLGETLEQAKKNLPSTMEDGEDE